MPSQLETELALVEAEDAVKESSYTKYIADFLASQPGQCPLGVPRQSEEGNSQQEVGQEEETSLVANEDAEEKKKFCAQWTGIKFSHDEVEKSMTDEPVSSGICIQKHFSIFCHCEL